MTIDEAIKHAEEVAEEHERHLKVYENMDEDRPLFREEENECRDCAEEHRQLVGWLKELKQLRKQTIWIPCSERLPEKSGVYIVTEKEYSVDDKENTGRFNLITEQVEFEGGKWRRASFYEVIAWMRLPEPYKAESEDKG